MSYTSPSIESIVDLSAEMRRGRGRGRGRGHGYGYSYSGGFGGYGS